MEDIDSRIHCSFINLDYKPRSAKTEHPDSSRSASSSRDPLSPRSRSRSHSPDPLQEAPLALPHVAQVPAVSPKLEQCEPTAASVGASPLHILATVSAAETAEFHSATLTSSPFSVSALPSPLLPLLLPSPSASLAVAASGGVPANDDPLAPDVLVTTRCIDLGAPGSGSLDSEVHVEWRRALVPGTSSTSETPSPLGACASGSSSASGTSLALRSSINTKVHALTPEQMLALTAALTDCVRSFTQPLTPEDAAALPLRAYTTEDNLKYFGARALFLIRVFLRVSFPYYYCIALSAVYNFIQISFSND